MSSYFDQDDGNLVGACLATGDRIFATGSDSVSKTVLRSCGCFCLISGHTIMVRKGPRSPKHIATIALCDPIFHLFSLLLGRDLCGDRILRSCLQKGPATTPASYACALGPLPHPSLIHIPVGVQNRVDLSFCLFPCFAVFGGPKINKLLGKATRKVSLSHPFLCASNARKTRI